MKKIAGQAKKQFLKQGKIRRMKIMKKIFSVIVGLLMFLMLPGVSFSYVTAPGPYISTQMGGSFLADSNMSDWSDTWTLEFEPGFASGFAAGFNFGAFRIEGELGYQNNEIDKYKVNGYEYGDSYSGHVSSGEMTANSFLGNIYLDFVNPSNVTPYITAGVGTARVELNDFFTQDYDDTVLAYQVGAGLGFQINPHMTIDLKYRYFTTEDPDFEGLKADLASHNVYCGFRYNF
jgi:opacity protein-like surface antigen